MLKDFDTYDFSVLPQLSKPKVLELSRCEWIEHKHNCCLVGSHGTGKTHIAVALARRRVVRVCGCSSSRRRSWSASWRRRKSSTPWTDSWANWSEQLLICDELGYVSLSRGGVELLFRVFSDRYEQRQPAGDEQLAVQRVEPDLPGRADDRGAFGPPDASLPDLRDERRELPLSRVDEVQEEPKGGVKRNCRPCPERLS